MRKNKITSIFLTVVMVLAISSGCSKSKQGEAAVQLTPVEGIKVTTGDIEATYTLSGKIKPFMEIAVVPKIPGKVEKVYKDIGERVGEGEKLFEIEATDLRQQLSQMDAQVLQSDAGVESAALNLSRTQGSSLEQQLMQSEAALKQATISYSAAKNDYENNKRLFDMNAISKQIFDAAKDKFDLAEMQYKNAQDNYDLLKNKISSESIDAAKTQVKQAQAGKSVLLKQKEMLQQKINDSVVTAPVSGIVAQKSVERGEMASQQSPAYTIVDIDKVIVEASVTEKIVNNISKGQEVVVTVKSLGDKRFKGVIDAMSPSTTAQSIGYPVKIIIDNKNHEIKPGMFAEVNFITEKKKAVPLVPMESVLNDKGKNIVYILEGDIVRKREVKTGLKDGKNTEITSGLNAGEQVLTKGQQYVTDGEKVQPVGGVQ